jgi:RimJ/RimL family protein N-acetyltransferase
MEIFMLYGKRIRLRGNEHNDLPKFVEWLNDPEVRRYLSKVNADLPAWRGALV